MDLKYRMAKGGGDAEAICQRGGGVKLGRAGDVFGKGARIEMRRWWGQRCRCACVVMEKMLRRCRG